MYGETQVDVESMPSPTHIRVKVGNEGGAPAQTTQAPVVHAASLKAAITQLRELTKANAGRSSQETLVANLVLLRAYGVDDEILDLVVEMTLAQNLDEETTAAINYLASGFLLALLALREEGIFRSFPPEHDYHAG